MEPLSATNVGCPSPSELDAAATGRMPEAIAAHLEGCQTCRELFTEMRRNAEFLAGISRSLRTAGGSGFEPTKVTLPGYQVLDEIHRGGQGVVYRGLQAATGRRVAIKVLLRGVMSTERQRMRFQIESELAARLRHPNIVGIFDRIAVPTGGFALVMELVEGVTLSRWNAPGETGAARARSIARVFAVIADAVHAAHQSGVIHRDLKPSNVMIDTEGNPRVLDFGLAKSIAEDRQRVTNTEDVACTLAYASPEQVNDPKQVGVRSDVYSLGVMLYEALAGSPPYETMDCALPVAIERICGAAPAPLRAAAARGEMAEVVYELELIVMKALEKETARRYESAAELGADLRAWLRGDRVKARPASLSYTVRKAVRRNRLGVAAGLVAMVGLMTGAAMWASSRAGRLVAEAEATAAAAEATAAAAEAKAAAATATAAESGRLAAEAGRLAAEATALDENAASEAARLLLLQVVPATNPEFRTNKDLEARRSIDLFAMRLDAGELLHRPRVELAARSMLADLYEAHRLFPEAIEQRRQVLAVGGETHELTVQKMMLDKLKLFRTLVIYLQQLQEVKGDQWEWRGSIQAEWAKEANETAAEVLKYAGASDPEVPLAIEIVSRLFELSHTCEDFPVDATSSLPRCYEVLFELGGTDGRSFLDVPASVCESFARVSRTSNRELQELNPGMEIDETVMDLSESYAFGALIRRMWHHLDEEPELAEAIRLSASMGGAYTEGSNEAMMLGAALRSEVSILDDAVSMKRLVDLKAMWIRADSPELGKQNVYLVAASMIRVALIHVREKEWDAALSQLEACRVWYKEHPGSSARGTRACLDLMVPLAIQTVDFSRAEDLSQERVRLYDQPGNRQNPKLGTALYQHAEIALGQGRLDEVGNRLRAATAVLREQSVQPAQAFLYGMCDVREAVVNCVQGTPCVLPVGGPQTAATMETDEYRLLRAGLLIVNREHQELERGFSFAFARPLFVQYATYRMFGERVRATALEQGLRDWAAELEQLLKMPPEVEATR